MKTEELQRRHEVAYQRACDGAGLAALRHPGEALDGEPCEGGADVMEQLAVVLSPLFGFIARGHLGGTMDMRAWCVLYCMRADYVGGETIAQYAARRGVTPKRVQTLLNELRGDLPALRPAHAKAASHVAAMAEGQRRAREARGGPARTLGEAAAGGGGMLAIGQKMPTPAGKESFAAPPSPVGSARQFISPRND